MKNILLFLCVSLLSTVFNVSEAQLIKSLGKKLENKAKQRADAKVNKAMDKGLDKVEEGTKVKKDEDGDVKVKEADGTKTKVDADGDVKVKNPDGTKEKGTTPSMTFTSKYDFVPGEKVVAFEDFNNTEIGDFPTRWNTNATAEMVTLNNKEGKWLKISKEGVWMPEFITNLPENFTLEFDLGVPNDFDGSRFILNIANLKNREKEYTDFYHFVSGQHGHYIHLQFLPFNGRSSATAKIRAGSPGNETINTDVDFKGWDNAKNNFAHISLWRQNQRLRVYLNGEKIYDLPKAFEAEGKYNTVTYAMQGTYKPDQYYYFLGNIRLAVGAADTRNKLITEGKFVSRGILFDVNSDRIKPESAGALKEIANVLKENADVKVKIVGHTDSDGDDAKNLDLSKRRAAAVKAALSSEFSIDASRMETDGKGETQPVDKNTTAEGKANNRRVEFIKQ